ncbi:unnamed protein product [Durusdinium trenchii]|uniref:PPIase cyclophilin-type domain-containing protein n=2 Tax=Durusdinium trenchii TaxID=1381693 RepID=A0ABP0NEU8_9DINO
MAGKSPEADDSTVRVRIDYETRGDRRGYLLLDLHPGWAPWSCDRFLKLVDTHFLDGQYFCRAIEGFVLDWNYGPCSGSSNSTDPHSQLYSELPWAKPCEMEKTAGAKQPKNLAGRMCFGLEDDGTTKTEVFINLVDNSARLDSLGFWPFAEVVGLGEGEVGRVERWEGGQLSDIVMAHGDIFFAGGASQAKAQVRTQVLVAGGNSYIDKTYPGLSQIIQCRRVEKEETPAKSGDT